ncbi:type II toxin-antitoxin system antitoxin SocA domain-containing protein [Porphyromonas endodontalis]|uniref:Panacea domain-containing protein n=1 Tax=Porphyromonas endodontalis TaxID=28124 RepID=UPI0028E61804|nr:type II toxin-antitoxin system antitoxin SocA domain-containing protein [Porphyromonas endodontalis]
MANNGIEDTFLYRSTDVARYLVFLANERKITVNMTKVQKLLYITYGVFLRVYSKRLLNEHPQAWPYGPVFPTTRNNLLKQDFSLVPKESIEDREKIENDEKLNKVVDFVFKNFGSWNAGQLSEWSHSKGSPWDETRKTQGFKWGNVISDKLILEYFCSIITVISDPE